MRNPNFRDPVFVRRDNEVSIIAKVIEWNDEENRVSIQFSDGQSSVLILAEDWGRIKSCIDEELQRVL